MDTLIQIDGLTKRFGSFVAVDGISLSVARGEVLGFLGPNGAGKSTTMKMVTGFLAPTSGSARVCGHDVVEETLAAQKSLGYLPEGAPLYPDMDAAGLMAFVAEIRGLSGSAAKNRIAEIVDQVNLHGVLRQPIDTLSKGYKRRVGLALAILDDPEVLVLDEPTDGLDPNQKHEVRRLIQGMAANKAILISTHILEEVEAVCTRAVIIDRGKVVADGTPAELVARSGSHNAVRLDLDGSPSGVAEKLSALDGVADVSQDDAGWLISPIGGASIAHAVSDACRDNGWEIRGLTVERGRLDEVFRAVTRSDVDGGRRVVAPAPTAASTQEKEEVNA